MLTQGQRSQFSQAERDLDEVTLQRLTVLLAALGTPGSEAFIRDFLDAMPTFIDSLFDVSALIGAAAYDLSRSQSDARGRFTAVLAETPDVDQVLGSARAAIFTQLTAADGKLVAPSPEIVIARLEASTPRLVRAGARQTAVVSAMRDPAKPRFQRITRAGACDWCRGLAARGAVYHSEDSAGSGKHFHDRCHCRVEAIFRGEAIPLPKAA